MWTILSSTSNIASGIDSFKAQFIQNFISEKRYMYFVNGLTTTLKITVFAVLIGIVLGFLIGIIRSTYDLADKPKNIITRIFLIAANFVCKVYLTVIRGTPVVIQLLIMYFVIFESINVDPVIASIMAFGFNSAAYVAEIFRSGIMSVDKGQFEAGRSLGFNYVQTMIYIIMPQAFKNVLPALGNELVVLLKETAVAGYIAVQDLTKGADIIRSRTFNALFPLLGAAAVYLIIVMILTAAIARLERRLRSSDH